MGKSIKQLGNKGKLALAVAGVAMVAWGSSAQATTYTTTAGGTWTTAATWSPAAPAGVGPSSGDDVSMAISANNTNLTITSAAAAKTFNSNSAGSITAAAGIVLTNGASLTINGGLGDITATSATSAPLIVVKNETQANAGSIVNAVNVRAANIRVVNSTAGATGYWTINNGQTYSLSTGGGIQIANIAASQKGVMTVKGLVTNVRTVALGAGTFTGQNATLVMDGGTVQMDSTGTASSVTKGTGTGSTAALTFNNGTISNFTGTSALNFTGINIGMTAGGTQTFDAATGNIVVDSASSLTGSGTFTKTGTKTLTLQGNTSGFTGAVVINGGTMTVGAASDLSGVSSINLNSAVLDTTANSTFALGAGQTFKGNGTFKTNSTATTNLNGTIQIGPDGDSTARSLGMTNGDTALSSTSILKLDLFTGTVGVAGAADKLSTATKSLTLGGTLDITNAGGFDLAIGQSWSLLGGNLSSSFNTINYNGSAIHNGDLVASGKWKTSGLNAGGNGTLSIVALASVGLSTTGGVATPAATVSVTGSGGGYVSSGGNVGGLDVGTVNISSEAGIDQPIIVALDLNGTSSDISALLSNLASANYTILKSGDAAFDQLNSHYDNVFDAAFSYNSSLASGTTGSFTWDFGGSGVTVNSVAVVPEPASLGALAIGAMGLLSRRRRKVTSLA